MRSVAESLDLYDGLIRLTSSVRFGGEE